MRYLHLKWDKNFVVNYMTFTQGSRIWFFSRGSGFWTHFTGISDNGEHSYWCRWHRWCHASPVSLIPFSKKPKKSLTSPVSLTPVMHALPASTTPAMHASPELLTPVLHHRIFATLPGALKEQSVKKHATIRKYFSQVCIQYSKEPSKSNKTSDFAGVVDTGEAPK